MMPFRWSKLGGITPPKTNMEPENHLFEKENHLPNLHFEVPAVSFPGCIPRIPRNPRSCQPGRLGPPGHWPVWLPTFVGTTCPQSLLRHQEAPDLGGHVGEMIIQKGG